MCRELLNMPYRVGCCPAKEAKGKYFHFSTKVFILLLLSILQCDGEAIALI